MILRAIVLAALAAFDGQGADPLKLERTISLAGVTGRIDHMAADVQGKRLLVAALGNNTLEVVDLEAGKRIRSISGLHEPQGVLYLTGPTRICVANGQDGELKIFGGASFGLVKAVPFSGDADNVRYYAPANEIYVGYGSGALGVVNSADGKKVGDIPLEGHPESFQLEQLGQRIFVNVPTAGQVAVVDRQSRRVTAKWALGGGRSNFPMALDETHHRLFVGCRKPPQVTVFNTDSGKIVAAFPCVGDTDDLFYDAVLSRLYVSGGEGFVSVFEQQGGDHYATLARIPTAAGARTSLFIPDLRRFCLAVPHRGEQSAEIRVYQTQP